MKALLESAFNQEKAFIVIVKLQTSIFNTVSQYKVPRCSVRTVEGGTRLVYSCYTGHWQLSVCIMFHYNDTVALHYCLALHTDNTFTMFYELCHLFQQTVQNLLSCNISISISDSAENHFKGIIIFSDMHNSIVRPPLLHESWV